MFAPSQSQSDPTAKLNKAVARIENMSNRDMAFYRVDDKLEEINRNGRAKGIGQAAIRFALRRVLFAKLPATEDHRYIRNEMSDLAYTEAEKSALDTAEQAAAQRMAKVSEEIAEGANPWLAHLKHNERDIINPLVVGLYQDDTGKVRSMFGPRTFSSKRQIENSLFGGRTEHKEVNLLEGEFSQVEPKEILKGAHWDALPTDLREHFEHGEILLTTGNDLYATSTEEFRTIAQSGDLESEMQLVDQKIKDTTSKYMLLYYSDYGGEDTGRTAVVMTTNGHGDLEPVKVQVGDKEFVVEVKGCGTKIGGFKGMHHRTGRDIVTGGAEAEQAETEFYRLEDEDREGAPKAVGSIIFDNKNEMSYNRKTSQRDIPYAQGYVIRLTPSTVRASFTGSEVYPDIEKQEFVERILQIYTTQLAEHMTATPPKILDRSSHSENILLWGDGESTFTDYSDHIVFADNTFPHYENHGGDMTPKKMLEYYLRMVDEIPGYSKGRDQHAFYELLTANLEAQGITVELEDTDELDQLVQKVWDGGMAYQVYRGRSEAHYSPEGMLRQYINNSESTTFGIDILHTSAEELKANEIQAREDLLEVIEYYRANPTLTVPEDEGANLDDWEGLIKTAPVTDLVLIADKIGKVQYQGNNYEKMDSDTRTLLRRKAAYFGEFHYITVSQFSDYFEHELDVVTSAQLGCPEDEKGQLADAEAEVRERIDHFLNLVNNDLPGLRDAIGTPEAARAMLQFSFYRS